ncbi:MAG: hypothetical protein EXR38_01100 [Methylotenera sp.]|nr:hypothetical protein [Methylotenera sp.]MSP99104.1 hypothetical protein [Methylotenera sp.]
MLAKGRVERLNLPLEAVICQQYGLPFTPDYPIAAIAAEADGVVVGDAYYLRADPVHLLLQRDCFSLGEPIPVLVAREHATLMLASLNQHFNQDGLSFLLGNSGAWYLKSMQSPQITTTLPSAVIGKNIHDFLPQGLSSSSWLAVLNEVQMLLHEHPVNAAREAAGEVAVNSVWLSGGGGRPKAKAQLDNTTALMANSIFHQGLATWAGLPWQSLPNQLEAVLQKPLPQVRLQLPSNADLDESWFSPLLAALKDQKIKQLSLNLGFYDKCLMVEIKPIDLYKFWRSAKPVMDYLQ